MFAKKWTALGFTMYLAIASLAFAADAPADAGSDPDAVDLTTTTHVSVHVSQALPDAAANELLKAAHASASVRINGPTTQFSPADFEVENRPFLQAVMDLCDTYDLNVVQGRRSRPWLLTKRGYFESRGQPPRSTDPSWAKSPASVNGPFAVFARDITRTSMINLSGNEAGDPKPNPELMRMTLVVVAEPRVSVVKFPFAPVMETCTDDKGTNLATPVQEQAEPRANANEASSWDLNCQLQAPDPAATRIDKLSGHLRLQVVTRAHHVELNDPGDNQSASIDLGGLPATLKGAKKLNNSTDEIVITVRRENTDPEVWKQRIALLSSATNIAATDGNALMQQNTNRGDINATDEYTLRIRIARFRGTNRTIGGPPVKYGMDIPLAAGEVNVPFDFTSLALPPK